MTQQVDLVLHNGIVWTHGESPEPTAVAVEAGRIVALGPDALALEAREVVDLGGGALLPGFADGHAHPVIAGQGARFADVRGKATMAEVLEGVARWARENPDAEWVRGDGYDPSLAPEGIFEAAWLDEVVPDRPVWLRASDYHTAWVNSVALEKAGIGPSTPDPEDGEIVRRADGTPVGTLREWGAWRMVERVAPETTAADLAECLITAADHLAAVGVTWVQDAWVEGDLVDAWILAARSGRLAVRGNLALLASPATWRGDLGTMVAQRERVSRETGGLVTAHSVKFFADGVIEAGTGALLEPYDDCPHSHGLPNWDWAELAEAITALDAWGFQAHIHAIGDAAVRASLDAVETAARRNGPRDRRAVIAHAQLIQPEDRPRFAELGVIANFEPLWARPEPLVTELTNPRLGEVRSALQYPIATLARAGHISFGSDWPVSSADPRAGLAVAVTRQVRGQDEVWVPEERITLTEALAAYTRGVAYQAFAEDDWGSVQVGARADLVHLATDPRTVAPQDLPDVAVLGTWLAGRRTA